MLSTLYYNLLLRIPDHILRFLLNIEQFVTNQSQISQRKTFCTEIGLLREHCKVVCLDCFVLVVCFSSCTLFIFQLQLYFAVLQYCEVNYN